MMLSATSSSGGNLMVSHHLMSGPSGSNTLVVSGGCQPHLVSGTQVNTPNASFVTQPGSDYAQSLEEQQQQQQQQAQSLLDGSQVFLSDDEDLFQCGKCKQQFSHLQPFLGHKRVCTSSGLGRQGSKDSSKMDLDLQLSLASGGHLHPPNQTLPGHLLHHSLGKSLLTSSTSSSPLLLHPSNNSPTSMLSGADLDHHGHHGQSVTGHHRTRNESPLGSAMGVLSESDLLVSFGTLDANMMASLGNSISPSSLLHLQGGDVSANTDDFAQFASHLGNNDSPPPPPNIQERAEPSLFASAARANGPNSNMTSSHHHHSSVNQTIQSPQTLQLNTIFTTSPTSFNFILNTTPNSSDLLIGGSGQESASNENSMGSPSRFLNLPPPTSSVTSTDQDASLVTSSMPSTSTSTVATSTVIHHHPQSQLSLNSQSEEKGADSTENLFQQGNDNSGKSPSQNVTDDGSWKKANTFTFKCYHCHRAFEKVTELNNHLPYHEGVKPYLCLVCYKPFTQKNHLRKHVPLHRQLSKEEAKTWFKKSVTESENAKKEREAQQINIKQEASEDNMPQLVQITAQEPHHQMMLINRTGATSTVATIPPSSSANPQSDLASPSSSKPQRSFNCPHEPCTFTANDEEELNLHYKEQHTNKTRETSTEFAVLSCNHGGCEQVPFSTLDAFLQHLREVHEKSTPAEEDNSGENNDKKRVRTYRCSICLNRYTTAEALNNHLATTSHHYPCGQCQKVFPCERYLRRHQLTHGAGLYCCNFCEKSFKTANYLKVHLVIHTGEKPFACKLCDAAFNRRDKLKRHELVHDPIKRYKCPHTGSGCQRQFNRPDKLKAHIMTHSGVKPYQCKECSRSFTRRAHLREHSKIHKENKGSSGSALVMTSTDGNNKNGTAAATTTTTTSSVVVRTNDNNNTSDNATNSGGGIIKKEDSTIDAQRTIFLNFNNSATPTTTATVATTAVDGVVGSDSTGQLQYLIVYRCPKCSEHYITHEDVAKHIPSCKGTQQEVTNCGLMTTSLNAAATSVAQTPIITAANFAVTGN